MSVTADQLSKTGARRGAIDTVVRDYLGIIDDKLQGVGSSWGRNIVRQELPVNFSIPGLGKRNSQLVIYTSIIRSLRERGFSTRICLEPERTTLYIEWVTGLDPKEIEAMRAMIRQSIISSDDVRGYLRVDEDAGAGAKANPAMPSTQ